MMERDRANKAVAIQSGGEREWSMYRKLRNVVTMLNKNPEENVVIRELVIVV